MLQKPRRQPIQSRDRLQVLLPKDLRDRLDAARDGRSPGPIVRAALEAYLECVEDFSFLYDGEA